jgi:hypothetical protein
MKTEYLPACGCWLLAALLLRLLSHWISLLSAAAPPAPSQPPRAIMAPLLRLFGFYGSLWATTLGRIAAQHLIHVQPRKRRSGYEIGAYQYCEEAFYGRA